MRCEPWEHDEVLHAELHRLLLMLMESGPATMDRIRRYMLRPHELAVVMPEDIREDNVGRTIAGFVEYLEDPGRAAALDAAAVRWRAADRHVRSSFVWDDLSPGVVHRAHLRARLLLLHAQKHGWVVAHENDDAWRLTEQGLAAVDQFWTDGVRE